VVAFCHDQDQQLAGAVSSSPWRKAPPTSPWRLWPIPTLSTSTPDAISAYNLLVLPVLDHDDDHLIGVLTIDDILEATIPLSGTAGATEDEQTGRG